jgi:uncharacterized membrane protein YbhN (UPF0104 family)
MGGTGRRLLRQLPAVLGLVLLAGAVYVVQREFRGLKVEDIAAALRSMPRRALVIAFLWTLLAYLVLTFYDRFGTYYAGLHVRYRRVALASFCAYTLAHNIGFAAVSGAAVRYRLYAHWGLTPLQIAKVVAFCSLTFGLGGMVLGGIVLVMEPDSVPFFGRYLPAWALRGLGVALWVGVLAYVGLAQISRGRVLFGHRLDLPGLRIAVVQVLVATADVAVTAAIGYTLLPAAPGLTYLRFLGVYLASYTAGLAASIPGGIGVFDTAMLIGLSPYLEPPQIVGAIVVFRLYYYILPLFLAGGLFAGNEVMLRWRARLPPLPAGVLPGERVNDPDLVVGALAGAVALCGALLLGLGIVAPRPDFSWIEPDFAEVAMQAGAFVPSLIGAALMVSALAMAQRVTLAWGLTLALLLAAAVFTLAEGQPVWLVGVLLLAGLLIAPFRSAFYRHARLLSGPIESGSVASLLVLVGCTLALAAFAPHVRRLADNAWWEVVLSPAVPNSLRASVALTVALALFALWRLLRPGRVGFLVWGDVARARFSALGGIPPPQADGLLWGEAGRAALCFRRTARALVALGDPVGPVSDGVSAIWRLHDLARQERRDPAVWRAGPRYLKVYADLGLAAVPLGADGSPLGVAPGRIGPRPPQYLICRAEHDFAALLEAIRDFAL